MNPFVESSMEGAIACIIRNSKGTLVDAHNYLTAAYQPHRHRENNSIANGLDFFPSPNLGAFTL